MSDWLAYVDGGCHGNPACSGIGALIERPEGRRTEISEWIGAHDNNYAEYAALAVALEYALAGGCQRLQVFSDSQVVVRQITGSYRCQSSSLRGIYEVCTALIPGLESFAITHIPRDYNRDANRLAQAAVQLAHRSTRFGAESLAVGFLDLAIARAARQNASYLSLPEPSANVAAHRGY